MILVTLPPPTSIYVACGKTRITGRRKSDRGKSIQAASGVRVLAVDDDPAYLRYLKLVLTRAGFDFHFTTDGRSAIDRVRHDDAIGLLLVDLVMPEMDGIETLKNIRKTATTNASTPSSSPPTTRTRPSSVRSTTASTTSSRKWRPNPRSSPKFAAR